MALLLKSEEEVYIRKKHYQFNYVHHKKYKNYILNYTLAQKHKTISFHKSQSVTIFPLIANSFFFFFLLYFSLLEIYVCSLVFHKHTV